VRVIRFVCVCFYEFKRVSPGCLGDPYGCPRQYRRALYSITRVWPTIGAAPSPPSTTPPRDRHLALASTNNTGGPSTLSCGCVLLFVRMQVLILASEPNRTSEGEDEDRRKGMGTKVELTGEWRRTPSSCSLCPIMRRSKCHH
jgi:hypothetical protein